MRSQTFLAEEVNAMPTLMERSWALLAEGELMPGPAGLDRPQTLLEDGEYPVPTPKGNNKSPSPPGIKRGFCTCPPLPHHGEGWNHMPF